MSTKGSFGTVIHPLKMDSLKHRDNTKEGLSYDSSICSISFKYTFNRTL